MKSIAIVDKYPIVRVGLRQVLTENFESYLLIESDNLSQFSKTHSNNIPDLFIIGNTFELSNLLYQSIIEIKKINPASKMIVFDENPDYLKIARSFKAGAKGYLTKLSDLPELLKCVSKVKDGGTYICHDALELILPSFVPNNTGSKKGKAWLSPQEYDVSNLLLSGDSISTISKKMDRKDATIRSIKARIFKKLNITDIANLKEALKKHLDSQNDTPPDDLIPIH